MFDDAAELYFTEFQMAVRNFMKSKYNNSNSNSVDDLVVIFLNYFIRGVGNSECNLKIIRVLI